MQFNIIFKTIFEYFVLCIQIRFVSTEKTTLIALRASCYMMSIYDKILQNKLYLLFSNWCCCKSKLIKHMMVKYNVHKNISTILLLLLQFLISNTCMIHETTAMLVKSIHLIIINYVTTAMLV